MRVAVVPAARDGLMVAQPVGPTPTAEDRIRAALWFVERGFKVFPVHAPRPDGTCSCPLGPKCDNPGKHPITANGFKSATDDPARIRTFLSQAGQPNYGLVCPDGVFALDVDGDGVWHLAELEASLGPLPPTLRTRTRGGEHIFLRWPSDKPRPIGQMFGYVTRWGSGSGAGYVIGPRSVHASGYVYQPASGAFAIAELPPVWVEAVLASPEPSDAFLTISSGGYQLPDYGYTGSRYDEIVRFVASRYMRGIPIDEIWVGVLYSLAPRFAEPLSEPELRSRFERAWKATPERLGPPHERDAPAPIVELPPTVVAAPPVDEPSWPAPPGPEAFHGVLGDIVAAVEPHTEADPVAILATLLAAVGACMGRWRTLYQGSEQAANLFVALVGDSATGRKGTAASIGRDVMLAAYPEWERIIVTGLGSGEGLVAHLKARAGETDPDKRDHRALVLETEFGRLLTVMGREGSTLSPVIRDAWDGSAIGRFIAREQSLVPWHHVAITAHVTAVELRAKLSDVDAANGFGNRFLWLAVRRTRLVPFPESPRPHVAPFIGRLRAAIDTAQTPYALRWTEAAAMRWAELYERSTRQPRLGLLGALTARAEAQTARLALTYALIDQATAVGVEHLAAAEALWDYAERSAVHIFGRSVGNRRADQLLLLIADGPVEWMAARRDLGIRESSDLQEAVDVLVSAGLATVASVQRPVGGRPVRVIALRGQTAHFAQFAETGRTDGLTAQTMQTVQVPAQAQGPGEPA